MFPKRLTDGYNDFIHGRLPEQKALYEKLDAQGQSPSIMVIACGDSRVAPETVFNVGPGEIFTIRNIAAIVPPCERDAVDTSYHGTSAAVEFAVNALGVKHIVVMGHARCGGVQAFADKIEPLSRQDFIGKWVSQLEPIKEQVGPADSFSDRKEWLQNLEWATVRYSLKNLMTFPDVKKRVADGSLQLHAAYFGIATGLLFVMNPETQKFAPLNVSPS